MGAAAAGALMLKGLNDGLNVEAGSDKLAAQLDLTAQDSARLGGLAGELYAGAYGESMEEVNTALGAVATSLGDIGNMSDAELSGMTANALDFAAAFDVDVSRAVNSAGLLLQTGLAPSAEGAFDLITAASQEVPAALREDLLDASDEYSQFFAALGFSGEQAFAALVTGSEKGMYGIDKTGDAIKEFTIRSTDMSALSVTAYDTLGLSAEDMANKILAGGDSAAGAFDQIVGGLLGIKDPATQANTAIALFGTPLEDLSVEEIPQFLQGLKDSQAGMHEVGGSADEMGARLADNAKTDLTAFKRSMEQNVTNSLQPVLKLLGDLPGPAQTAISTLMGFGALAAPIGPFVLALTTMLPMLKSWEIGTKLVSAAQWLLNTAMFGFPIFWVIAGIVALIVIIVLIIKHWDTLRAVFIAVWEAIWSKLQQFGAWFAGGFMSIFRSVRDGIVGVITWIRDRWSQGWEFIKAAAANVVNWVTGIPGRIGAAFGSIVSTITAPFRNAFNGIARLWNGTVGRISFTIPAWVPMIGGRSWSVPDIPMLAAGGITLTGGAAWVGEHGTELVDLPRGARVSPLGEGGAAGGHVVIEWRGPEEILALIRKSVRVRGGSVQQVFGS